MLRGIDNIPVEMTEICDASRKKNCSVMWIGKDHPQRKELERFIAENYKKMHQAEISYFADNLFGCHDGEQFMASLGITFLVDRHHGFIEEYLDEPAEQAIAKIYKQPIAREQIVELGNLSSVVPGSTRRVIEKISPELKKRNVNWAIFAINVPVLNAFHKAGLEPKFICEAKHAKLKDQKTNWGSYYETKPGVYCIEVPST
jgi:hypothetical protein